MAPAPSNASPERWRIFPLISVRQLMPRSWLLSVFCRWSFGIFTPFGDASIINMSEGNGITKLSDHLPRLRDCGAGGNLYFSD